MTANGSNTDVAFGERVYPLPLDIMAPSQHNQVVKARIVPLPPIRNPMSWSAQKEVYSIGTPTALLQTLSDLSRGHLSEHEERRGSLRTHQHAFAATTPAQHALSSL